MIAAWLIRALNRKTVPVLVLLAAGSPDQVSADPEVVESYLER